MSFGNTPEALARRRYVRHNETEISERAFNLIIGAVLMWGFLLNYLMVAFFGREIAMWAARTNPFVWLIGYTALVIAGSVLISKPSPLTSFIGYNLIAVPIGVVLCTVLTGINPETVETTVLLTAIVTLSFMIAAILFPGFFLRMGRVLFFALLATLIGETVSMIFFRRGFMYEWIYAGIFSLYIGYDWARANTCAKTVNNAVDLSASLYLDIINLFLRILSIVMRNDRD
ncbi:MAG: US12 family protein [Clostridia bacterium]|nr:US12 family protein [Clostridia bacterium]